MTTPDKREYARKLQGASDLVTVFRDAEGNQSFFIEDSWEVRAVPFKPTEADLKIAHALFQVAPPTETPRFDLDNHVIDNDAFVWVQLRPESIALLSDLSRHMNSLDLALPSSQERAHSIATMAMKYTQISLKQIELERAIRDIVDCAVRTASDTVSEQPCFFDGWSEGPFSLDDVERMVAAQPSRAREFHLAGGTTFDEYNRRRETVAASRQAVRPAASQRSTAVRARRIPKLSSFAASLAAFSASVLGLGK